MTPDEQLALQPRRLLWRIIFTGLLFALYGLINGAVYPVTTIAVGRAAGGQFANDDVTSVTSQYTINFLSTVGWPAGVLFLLLIAVWWPQLCAVFRIAARRLFNVGSAIALGVLLLQPSPGHAYFSKTDWPEIYFILPNESAFWIPDTGANKDAQDKFMSEDYLKDNKIAAKRFQVPHVKLTGSSYGFDYYIPAGRLIIVDRTPYAREWTKDSMRGTAQENQAMQCQSSEGIDISIDVALSASVFEADAPRFLYRFGVKPPVGDRNTDEVKFQSVFHGKSLTEVMDTVVHGKVQTLFCAAFSTKTLNEINATLAIVIAEAEKSTKDYLYRDFGITLDYLGLAGSPTFPDTVQKAIDDYYMATRLQPVLPVLERQAQIRVAEGLALGLKGLGEGLKAHGLPSNLVAIPEGLSKWFTPAAPSAAPTAGPAATFVPAPTAPAAPAAPR